jgi:nucleoside-diphosphate-sugar epimerase
MKVLIIGGTGNISTAITQQLIQDGADVTVYNRGLTGAEFKGPYQVIKGDRTDYHTFEKQMKDAQLFDCVIDMIGYNPQDAQSLIQAFSGRTEQVIFCSTVDVYTKPAAKYPIIESEERKPSPSFPYAFKKAKCEGLLEDAAEKRAFALTIIRPAHTYNDDRTPISFIGSGHHLLKRIRQGKPIIMLGNGTSFWASAHRDDVAPTFAAAVCNPQVYGKSYHVAAEEWMTWEQHYNTVAEVMHAPPIHFIYIPTSILGRMAPKAAEWSVVNFTYNNIFDNSAAKRDLGYEYRIKWREGVGKIIKYLDSIGVIDTCPDDVLYGKLVARWEKLIQQVRVEAESVDA